MEEMDSLLVQIATHPFSAEGTMRWPYHAAVLQEDQAARYRGFCSNFDGFAVRLVFFEHSVTRTVRNVVGTHLTFGCFAETWS